MDRWELAMELNVNDRFIADPTEKDIADAIDAAPYPADWSINLEADDGTYIEAFPEDGAFRLYCERNDRRLRATDKVDAASLKTILGQYLRGENKWRNACQWQSEEQDTASPASPKKTSEPPAWAIMIMIGTIALVVLLFNLADVLPLPNSGYFWVGLIFLPMVMMLVLVVVAKMLEVRKSAQWPSAMGRVIRSTVEARHSKGTSDTVEVQNMPVVVYEFTANARKWTGNRISIGEDSGGANTEATLRRYPVGAAVKVFYDPKNPKDCVLERDPPAGMGKGCLLITVALAVFGFAVWYLVINATQLLGNQLPKGNAPLTVFATCFGLLLLLAVIAGRRAARAAADWPAVSGQIVVSEVESIHKYEDGRSRTTYAPAVEYAYQVHGNDYRGRQIKFGIGVSGSRGFAEKVITRYPLGSAVEVHYDPANPSNAALENPTGYYWFMLAIAIGCFAIAAYASGLFA